MGDKKQKEAMIKKVKQVLVVGACVLFVILMILSGMSSHWLTIFTVVKPGDINVGPVGLMKFYRNVNLAGVERVCICP